MCGTVAQPTGPQLSSSCGCLCYGPRTYGRNSYDRTGGQIAECPLRKLPAHMAASDDPEVELSQLCSNVDTWLRLQSEGSALIMARAHASLLELSSTVEAVVESCAASPLPKVVEPSERAKPLALPLDGASPPESYRRRTAPSPAFSTIDTVLAARHRRLTLHDGSPPPPPPVGLLSVERAASPPSAEAGVQSVREAERGQTLLAALARWQEGAAARVRGRMLATVTNASTAALAHAFRSWHVGARARVEGAAVAWRRRACRIARRAVLRGGWRRWCVRLAAAADDHCEGSWLAEAASAFAEITVTSRAWRAWRAGSRSHRALLDAADGVQTHLVRSRCVSAHRCWRSWARRREQWRRQLERRADARGGFSMLHRPCMQRFERRAIFLEEGSTGVADAYRARRTRAVVLCRWWAASIGVAAFALE